MAITFNADAALAQLQQLVEKHGPEAINIAAQVVQVDAVGDLLRAGGALLLSLIGWVALAVSIRAMMKDVDPDEWPGFVATTGFVWGAIFLLGSLLGLLDVWNWVALSDPKLALAHDIYQRIAK